MSDLNAGGDFSFCHLNIHRALVGASQTAGVHELDLIDSLRELMIGAFRAADHAELDTALDLLGRGLGHVLIVLVALGTGVMLVAVVAAVGQGGFFLATKTVQPKLAKLSPKNNATRAEVAVMLHRYLTK